MEFGRAVCPSGSATISAAIRKRSKGNSLSVLPLLFLRWPLLPSLGRPTSERASAAHSAVEPQFSPFLRAEFLHSSSSSPPPQPPLSSPPILSLPSTPVARKRPRVQTSRRRRRPPSCNLPPSWFETIHRPISFFQHVRDNFCHGHKEG